MVDRYTRDDDGNITGKAITEDSGEGPKEAPAYTGRPPDVAPDNSTFASRAKKAGAKQVKAEDVEDKAVHGGHSEAKKSAARKRPA